MAKQERLMQLLREIDKVPIKHYKLGTKQYLNTEKVEDLFSRIFGGASEIARIVRESDRASIAAGAEAGIGLPDLTQWFLRLKTLFETKVESEEAIDHIIKSEFDSRWKMLLAEAVLEREERIQTEIDIEGFYKPFARLTDLFKPFLEPTDEELKTDLENFVGPEAAEIIFQKKRREQAIHPDDMQFVYVAKEPIIIASVLYAPPRPNLGIEGNTDACSSPGPFQSRVYFGAPVETQKSVSFMNIYYVMDVER